LNIFVKPWPHYVDCSVYVRLICWCCLFRLFDLAFVHIM
jgi:hypothetical protein